jgi:hypothetical protein
MVTGAAWFFNRSIDLVVSTSWAHLAVPKGIRLTSHTEPDRVSIELEPSSFFKLISPASQPKPS